LKIDKLIIEPRINIRQQVSKQFALKLEGNLKIKPPLKSSILKTIFGVEKRRWVLVNNEDIPIATSKQSSLG
jgi:hypothetical protein